MVQLSGLGWAYVALIGLFALIFIAALVTLVKQGRASPGAGARVAPPPPATAGTLRDAMAAPGAIADPYMLRFVVDESGERVGETLSMTSERVIVKREGAFHALPLESVTIQPDGQLVAHGVDWERARTEGEAWRDAQAAQHEALEFDDDRDGTS